MADEPNWATVLRVMHEDKKTQESVTPDDEQRQVDFIAGTTDLPPDEVRTLLQYLNTVEVIEPAGTNVQNRGPYLLTEKGFQVAFDRELKSERFAHERDLTELQDRTNRALLLVTGVLALSALLGLMPITFEFPQWVELIVVGVLVGLMVGILVLFGLQYHRPELRRS